jgi:hypothetical protein
LIEAGALLLLLERVYMPLETSSCWLMSPGTRAEEHTTVRHTDATNQRQSRR